MSNEPINTGAGVPKYPYVKKFEGDETARLEHEAKWGKSNDKPLFERLKDNLTELGIFKEPDNTDNTDIPNLTAGANETPKDETHRLLEEFGGRGKFGSNKKWWEKSS